MEDMVYDMNYQSARLAAEAIRKFENGNEGDHFIAGTLKLTKPLQCRLM